MVLSTLRTCSDRTTIPPIRSDPCARYSRLNHSHAASAGSERRLLIAAVTGDSFADMIVFRQPPNRVHRSEAEGVPSPVATTSLHKRPDLMHLAKLTH